MKAKCKLPRRLDGRRRKAGDERIVDAVETGSSLPGADRALFARQDRDGDLGCGDEKKKRNDIVVRGNQHTSALAFSYVALAYMYGVIFK